MRNKKVLLRISDPKLYAELYTRLKRLGVQISDTSDSLTISDPEYEKLNISSDRDVSKILASIYLKWLGKEAFDELLIGVDTNQGRLAVAALADGQLVETRETDIEKAHELLESIISTYPHRRIYIGIGIGNQEGRKVYNYLKRFFPYAKGVDENRTNSKSPYISIKDKDMRAAYAIALRSTL
ncbi:MAG: hypothetical protein QXN30_06900 [Metallosphaera sp.]